MQPMQAPDKLWWPSRTTTISFAAAMEMVAAQSAAILSNLTAELEPCALSDSLGRILGSAVVAPRDQPPFPRVTRDGFAVRVQDLAPGAPLHVVAQLRAGEPWPASRPDLAAGEAIEIMTGAPLPPGADAVLMVEHALEVSEAKDGLSDPHVRAIVPASGQTLRAGENVVAQGSEAHHGDIVLQAGTRLQPEEIALIAACGLRTTRVHPQPKVAILATGDELVEPSASPSETPENSIAPHQIYDSNSHLLAALTRQASAIPLRHDPVRDRKEDLAAAIRLALQTAPLLLLTGGVSMGRYDLVEEALTDLGAEFFFTGVKMQPGKPVVFGRIPAGVDRPGAYFFGLPGNPVSALVTFRLFVQPLLAAISGERFWQPRIALATLAAEARPKPGLTRFLPAHLDTAQPSPTVTPVQSRGSGDLTANARANCYVIVPEDSATLAAGQAVRVLLR